MRTLRWKIIKLLAWRDGVILWQGMVSMTLRPTGENVCTAKEPGELGL